jgi:hypothetical protein
MLPKLLELYVEFYAIVSYQRNESLNAGREVGVWSALRKFRRPVFHECSVMPVLHSARQPEPNLPAARKGRDGKSHGLQPGAGADRHSAFRRNPCGCGTAGRARI